MNGEKIKYTVEFRKRKTIGIIIKENGEVIVRAPNGVSFETIDRVIEKKRKWIEQKVIMFKERKQLASDEVMYLGRICKVRVIEQKFLKKNFVDFKNDTFFVNVSELSKANKVLEKWFREECLKKVTEIVFKYTNRFKEKPKEIRVKSQKTKWGCCTYDNKIFLNWHIIMARESAMEYVVVHEMCHMVYKNHSKDYWKCVENILPEFKKEHLYLKENGYLMKIK
ncbi:MAG: M48 family metallopeptidase [Clostridium sp.]|nr:M48 family metallopeptidase [Clostridium sp.]